LDPVAGSTPIGAQKVDASLKPNPYIPEGTTVKQQQGQCLCVPNGKCTAPTPGPIPPPTPNNIPPINTDGAGLIDVRIVNRVIRIIFLFILSVEIITFQHYSYCSHQVFDVKTVSNTVAYRIIRFRSHHLQLRFSRLAVAPTSSQRQATIWTPLRYLRTRKASF
jgi:hypothetical protein